MCIRYKSKQIRLPVIYKFNVKGRLLIKEAISGDADKVFAMKLLNGWHPREDTGRQTRRHQRDDRDDRQAVHGG